MNQENNAPVFVHSLFRAGSTYIFNVFRRSDAGYWAYQEPLNEKLVENAKRDGGFQSGPAQANSYLRHPELDKSHSHEFHVAADEVVRRFRQNFPYELFFTHSQEKLVEVVEYFRVLQERARGRPVFQCCRTTGRVPPLKQALGGVHLFLWRNPWDQWWSYKNDPYFESRNLFIAGASQAPAVLQGVKQELGIPPLDKVPDHVRLAYFANRKLDAAGSYRLFYTIWCLAMLDARANCDVEISIDSLSLSAAYREELLQRLEALGINGLNFSDCSVPMTVYGERDGAFFEAQETRVHELLLACGRPTEAVDELKELAARRQDAVVDTSQPEHHLVRDAMRARELALRAESALSAIQTELFETRAKLHQAGPQPTAVRH